MEFTKEQSCSVMERNSILKNSKSAGRVDSERESFGPEVLVVHEDSPTGLRAREALDNLADQLEIKTCFLISLCRFGMLEDAELAEPVLQQAKRTDILFLTLHGDRELPTAVRNWLLCWLETRDFKPCALVVSLDSSNRDLPKFNSTWNFLRVITAPLEVDLFLHLGEPLFMAKCQERLGMECDEKSAFLFSAGKHPAAPEKNSGSHIAL
jgi:hypothetical protein